MKKSSYLLFFLLTTTILIKAADPIINYQKINDWCSSVVLTSEQIQSFKTYLQEGAEFTSNCNANPDYKKSAEGKALLSLMAAKIGEFVQNEALKTALNTFQKLMYEELQENPSDTKNYLVMSIIYDAANQCLN